MAQRDYPNSGILFINDRKGTERDPDHTGRGEFECPSCGQRTEFWLNAWNRLAKSGSNYLSLSLKAKAAAATTPRDDRDIDSAFGRLDDASRNSARTLEAWGKDSGNPAAGWDLERPLPPGGRNR
jgi:hypothetical protein